MQYELDLHSGSKETAHPAEETVQRRHRKEQAHSVEQATVHVPQQLHREELSAELRESMGIERFFGPMPSLARSETRALSSRGYMR